MKIRKLHLKDFRLFRELEVEFTDDHLTVLIGGNGSGKSAVLDAIAVGMARYVEHSTAEELPYFVEINVAQKLKGTSAHPSALKFQLNEARFPAYAN